MIKKPINEFINDCNRLSEEMSVEYSELSPSFVFSNTGRRGDVKRFSITIHQLIDTIDDISNNLAVFNQHSDYVEADWRQLFSNHLTNSVAHSLAGVQTLPLFELINKVTHIANNSPQDYEYKKLIIDAERLSQTKKYLESQIPDNSTYLFNLKRKNSKHTAKNEIIYGAPGTGKSHKIAEKTAGQKKIVTVFHPDTQHSDFVGALKPTMSGGAVTYQFRPGPFTTALIEALTHADEHVYLIIEEINRAPAAAVFGELFQLLDRENGASKYDIDATDPDMLSYINQQLADQGIAPITKLALPNNLSLLATMNSSDQAVMPLDTAFKRRWSFEYVKIDFSNPDVSQQTFKLSTSDGEKTITWKNFANHVVNRKLQDIGVPEDRLLGPFFLNKEELDSDESAQQSLCGKLFVYLWDDVLRHKGRTNLFKEGISTFGALQALFNQGDSPVFNETVDQLIIEHSEAVPAVNDVDEEDRDNNE